MGSSKTPKVTEKKEEDLIEMIKNRKDKIEEESSKDIVDKLLEEEGEESKLNELDQLEDNK